jgi:serine/threonine-protein kinase
MLRLKTFGGVLLLEAGGPHQGAAAQRRRLALLALLASAGDRPISRDKILTYFWPDADPERGRHALGQALHAVQRALDTSDLFLGTAALQLNPARITTDVGEFVSAAAAGHRERAVGLYAGPFLDGFHLEGLREFEGWASAERRRHADAASEILAQLAAAAAARRDHAGAVGWWRRLVAHDPLDSGATLCLMQALATVGDRPGALRAASIHEALVRQQLEADVDPAVAALVAQIKGGQFVPAPGPPAGAEPPRAGDGELSRRDRVQQRQRRWVERAFGARLHVHDLTSMRRAATTYAAYDRSRGAAVELTLVSPGVAAFADEEALAASLDRVRALDDAHVVPLYEYGVVDDVLFYVSARPDGETLQERLGRERQLPVADALDVAGGVARALCCAHAADVRHGDLRPKHVVLTAGGAMVHALGVADVLGRITAQSGSTTAVSIGAPEYLSPEQLAGDSTYDGRADIYALGCLLYAMLAGEVPFASANRQTLVSNKLTQPPPSVRAARDTVPAALDAVVRRCLARSPSDRFRTAAELRSALDAVPR